MGFEFSDRHISDFYSQGYAVFRGILPPSLIADLRRACDRGRDLVRQSGNQQAQRFQPIGKFDLDLKSFEDYRDLPALRDAVSKVLSPRHVYGDLKNWTGVLIEPAEHPWCTNWHRDWLHHNDKRVFQRVPLNVCDLNLFNQINCALYEDSSTWFVPGSHFRPDLPSEASVFPSIPAPAPAVAGLEDAAAEVTCLEYCRQMPGAVQLHLNAGDFALYRNTMWHVGNYAPYRKRATLHDVPMTPEYECFIQAVSREVESLKVMKS